MSATGLALVSFTPAEMPIPVAATMTVKPISFTAVVRLYTRPDGTTQVITLATLSFKGRVLGTLKQIASNVFQVDVPDRTALFDTSLATKAGDHPKIAVTLSFTDDRGDVKNFDQQIGVECTATQYFDNAYFCNGQCRGLYTGQVTPTPESCRGCNLACTYTNPSGVTQPGTCSIYNRSVMGGEAETCGTFVAAPALGTAPDLTKSCDQICAQYSGRGKPAKCIDRCYARSDGQTGGYGDASGQSYGSVTGIIGAYYNLTGLRGIIVDCPEIPAVHIANLPSSARPDKTYTFNCCCTVD